MRNEFTEFMCGRQYAEANEFDGPVNVDEMTGYSTDIPEFDYLRLLDAGIKQPSARKYWTGFNSFYDKA